MPDGAALPVTALDDALARVSEGEHVALTRDGATVAVLVPVADAEAWEAFEDEMDARAADEARAEYERTGGAGSVTLEELLARDGLTRADLTNLPE